MYAGNCPQCGNLVPLAPPGQVPRCPRCGVDLAPQAPRETRLVVPPEVQRARRRRRTTVLAVSAILAGVVVTAVVVSLFLFVDFGKGEIDVLFGFPTERVGSGRTRLQVANGLAEFLTLSIDGREVATIPPYGIGVVDLPAGRHTLGVRSSLGVTDELRARMKSKTSWVFDPGARCRFGIVEGRYTANATVGAGERLLSERSGERWFRVEEDFDLATPLPETVRVVGGGVGSVAVRTKLCRLVSTEPGSLEKLAARTLNGPAMYAVAEQLADEEIGELSAWIRDFTTAERLSYLERLRPGDATGWLPVESQPAYRRLIGDLLDLGTSDPALNAHRGRWDPFLGPRN